MGYFTELPARFISGYTKSAGLFAKTIGRMIGSAYKSGTLASRGDIVLDIVDKWLAAPARNIEDLREKLIPWIGKITSNSVINEVTADLTIKPSFYKKLTNYAKGGVTGARQAMRDSGAFKIMDLEAGVGAGAAIAGGITLSPVGAAVAGGAGVITGAAVGGFTRMYGATGAGGIANFLSGFGLKTPGVVLGGMYYSGAAARRTRQGLRNLQRDDEAGSLALNTHYIQQARRY